MQNRMTMDEMCAELGKSRPYVRGLQHALGVPVARQEPGYGESYLCFMRKIVALRVFSVPVQEIHDLFGSEKKILEMLHFDSMSDSPTWFLDLCDGEGYSPSRLLLTGYDVGFPIADGHIQENLDFRERQPELFNGHEMGVDARRVLDLYLRRVEDVSTRVRAETSVIEAALCWAEQAFD